MSLQRSRALALLAYLRWSLIEEGLNPGLLTDGLSYLHEYMEV